MYYTIVLVIAVILLIVGLVFVGILLKNGMNKQIFPDYQYVCPDYWIANGDICYPPKSNINMPTPDKFSGASPSIQHLGVNMNNEKTAVTSIHVGEINWMGLCDKASWAKKNGIFWDGVANTNQC